MKKWICLPLCVLLLLALFCAGQSKTSATTEHTIRVYFLSSNMTSDSALIPESRILDPKQDSVQQLIQWLLADPKDADHDPLFPSSVTLISKKLSDSVLTLNFSSEYSELTGADLTVANAAVVLTVTQLEDIDGVILLSAGERVLPNTTLPLTTDDFDLSGKSADPVGINVPLYFLSENGVDVVAEPREVQASDSSISSAAQAVLDALCTGPQTKGLHSFFPTTSEGVTLKIKSKTCFLTINDVWRNVLLDADAHATLSAWAITATLTGVDGIDQVIYLEDSTEIPGLSNKEIAAVYNTP